MRALPTSPLLMFLPCQAAKENVAAAQSGPRPIGRREQARRILISRNNPFLTVITVSSVAEKILLSRGVSLSQFSEGVADIDLVRQHINKSGEGFVVLSHYVANKKQMRPLIVTRTEERSIRIMIGKRSWSEDISSIPLVPVRTGRSATKNPDGWAIYKGKVDLNGVAKPVVTPGTTSATGTRAIFPSEKGRMCPDLTLGQEAFYKLEIVDGRCELYSKRGLPRMVSGLRGENDGEALFVTRQEQASYKGRHFTLMVGDVFRGHNRSDVHKLQTVVLAIYPSPKGKTKKSQFILAQSIVEHRGSRWRQVFVVR